MNAAKTGCDAPTCPVDEVITMSGGCTKCPVYTKKFNDRLCAAMTCTDL